MSGKSNVNLTSKRTKLTQVPSTTIQTNFSYATSLIISFTIYDSWVPLMTFFDQSLSSKNLPQQRNKKYNQTI